MKFIVATVLFLGLAACASAPPAHDPDNDAQLGMEAYQAGRYDMAQFYLARSLTSLPLSEARTAERTAPWRESLANVYWEMGRDEQLLSFAELMLPADDYKLWTCRVDEREGYTNLAHACYLSVGDEADAARAARSAIIVQTFMPDNTRYGTPAVAPP